MVRPFSSITRRTIDTLLGELWCHIKASRCGPKGRPQLVRIARRLSAEDRRLHRLGVGQPGILRHFERSACSQNGEDGIIEEVFSRIGVGGKFFVEIAAADGRENCTRNLAEAGWRGVWFEGDPTLAATAREQAAGLNVEVVEGFVDRTTIVTSLMGADVPERPDLAVIDIDGFDYWLWEAMEVRFRPRVVVIEYNAVFGPHLRWVLPYDPRWRWGRTARHGATLSALDELGRRLGYRLVGCDSLGVNAFFVRFEEAGAFSQLSVRDHWVPPRYGLPYGHPWCPPTDTGGPPLDQAQRAAVSWSVIPLGRRHVFPGEYVYGIATVTNGSDVIIGGSEPYPLHVASMWAPTDDDQPTRSREPCSARPGETRQLLLAAQAPFSAGRYELRADLVQEGVAWFSSPLCSRSLGTWTVMESKVPSARVRRASLRKSFTTRGTGLVP